MGPAGAFFSYSWTGTTLGDMLQAVASALHRLKAEGETMPFVWIDMFCASQTLLAGAFLAIGSCMSALAKNQVIAFILSVAVCFLFIVSGLPMVLDALAWAPQWLIDAVASLSFLIRFDSISKGVIDLRDLLYFVTLIVAWLAATAVVVDLKKAA